MKRTKQIMTAVVLGVALVIALASSATAEVSFTPNTLNTTPFGPAYADIVLRPPNFLPCFGGPIALCYYSGPGPAGPSQPDVSCELTDDGRFANCNCFEIPIGLYFVDINAILDLDVYLKTVKACGQDGTRCRSPNTAPVCQSVNSNQFIPGADLISTFSLYLDGQNGAMPIGQTNCNAALYAGCMTAPCSRTGEVDPNTGLSIVQCLCPTFDGPYQVGQANKQDMCDLTKVPPPVGGSNFVWSAAYAPLIGAKTFPTPPCFPDAPVDSGGCPMLSPKPPVIPTPPKDVNCEKVCAEYKKSNQGGAEIGFTCDATLCTATRADLDLVKEACSGLQNGKVSEILKLEFEVGCSCCASQICGCKPNQQTNEQIGILVQQQRAKGISTQCDQNGTLCGAQP